MLALGNMESKRPLRGHFVSLRDLRRATGKKQSEVCAFVTRYLDYPEGKEFTEGTLSLIERGERGASIKVRSAIAAAYGLEPEAIVSEYAPQDRQSAGGLRLAANQ